MFQSSEETNYSIGTLNTKIVGVRFYNGIATPGERTILKRESHNQYDANAVRVENVMHIQIGHIPRGIAAKLAKYMVGSHAVISSRYED